MSKILIIRFSSIGDIVLTTPVIRMAKNQIPNSEIHFLTKESFRTTLENNPHIDKLWTFRKKLSEVIPELKKEGFEAVIDLHNNLRSARVKRKLKTSSHSFNKLNVEKWLMVNFKRNRLPDLHIVDRYRNTLNEYGVEDDGEGLDYFLGEEDEEVLRELPSDFADGYMAWVIGGSYFTKMLPAEKVTEVIRKSNKKFVLLGGPEDQEKGEEIRRRCGDHVFNACGKFSLNESAALVKNAKKVLSNDTGLMHIAAAFHKPVLSFWGNTIPEFGMYPYRSHMQSRILEVEGLNCRPCSKLGYRKKCPKGHFYCMQLLNNDEILDWIEEPLKSSN